MRFVAAALVLVGAALATVPCTYVVHDDATGKLWSYDLTPLNHPDGSGDDLTSAATESGSTYYVNVCGQTLSCPGNSVCERDEYYNLNGRANTSTQAILASDTASDASQGVMVSYTSGSCWENGPAMKTIVYVGCSAGATSSWIGDVVEGNCTRVIRVWSAAGCGVETAEPSSGAAEVPCTFVLADAATGRQWEYDLTALHHAEGSGSDLEFSATATGSKYWANLCGSTLSCSGNAVCELDEYLNYIGCGATISQVASPIDGSTDLSSGISLTYTDGDICSGGPRVSTVVEVGCRDVSEPGYIAEVQETNCSRKLVIWSPHGCGKEVLPETSSSEQPPAPQESSESEVSVPCTYIATDAQGRQWLYDLTALHHEVGEGADLHFGTTQYGSDWYVNLCGQTLYCKGDAVCERDEYKRANGFGLTRTQEFLPYEKDYSAGVVVQYSQGDNCTDSGLLRRVAVTVGCSKVADPGYIGEVFPGNCTADITIWSVHGCGILLNPESSVPAESSVSSESSLPTLESSETPVPPTPESSEVPPAPESSEIASSSEEKKKPSGKSGFWWWWILLIGVVGTGGIAGGAIFYWRKVHVPRSGYISINTGKEV